MVKQWPTKVELKVFNIKLNQQLRHFDIIYRNCAISCARAGVQVHVDTFSQL